MPSPVVDIFKKGYWLVVLPGHELLRGKLELTLQSSLTLGVHTVVQYVFTSTNSCEDSKVLNSLVSLILVATRDSHFWQGCKGYVCEWS